MVRANGIDFLDLVAECHSLVNQKLNEIVRGRFSGQQLEFFADPIDPGATNAGADLRCGGGEVSEKKGRKTNEICVR